MKKMFALFCRSCEAVSLFVSRIAMWLSATIVAVMMFEVIRRAVFYFCFLSRGMKKIVAGFCRSCEAVSLFVSRIAMWLSALVVAVMMFEVVARYVFNSPTLWANESSLWMAGFLYLFAGLYAMRERGHIRVTVVYNSLPRKAQLVLDAIGTVVVVLFAVALVVGGWDVAWKALMRWETLSTAWEPPIPATIKPMILVCTALIAVQAVSNFFADFRKDAPAPPEGADGEKTSGVD